MKIFDVAFTDIASFNQSYLNMARTAPKTLSVQCDRPTAEIAELISRQNPNLVVLLDKEDNIRGLVEPNYVREGFGLYRQQAPDDFAEAVLKLVQVKELPVTTPTRRPKLYWCENGKHFTSEKPCSEHP